MLRRLLDNFYDDANSSLFAITFNVSLAIDVRIVALSSQVGSNNEFIFVRHEIYSKGLFNEVMSNDNNLPAIEDEGKYTTCLAFLSSANMNVKCLLIITLLLFLPLMLQKMVNAHLNNYFLSATC